MRLGDISQPPGMRTLPHFHERAPEVNIQSSRGLETPGQVRVPALLATGRQLLGPLLERVVCALLLVEGNICHDDDEGLKAENRNFKIFVDKVAKNETMCKIKTNTLPNC